MIVISLIVSAFFLQIKNRDTYMSDDYINLRTTFAIINAALSFLSSPFKFFVAKEFLLVFYDELKNKGISTKI
jgi:hypothetical protein